MSNQQIRHRMRASRFLMIRLQRWRSSSILSRQTRLLRKAKRAEQRLQLLLLETNHQHLLLKEIQEQQDQMENRLLEMQRAEQWWANPLHLQKKRQALTRQLSTQSGESSPPQ